MAVQCRFPRYGRGLVGRKRWREIFPGNILLCNCKQPIKNPVIAYEIFKAHTEQLSRANSFKKTDEGRCSSEWSITCIGGDWGTSCLYIQAHITR